MSLRFQRLIIIFITLIFLFGAVILILFNTKQNIVFFYTPTELLDIKIKYNSKIRIGGFVKKNSLEKIDKNKYKFEITDNKNNLTIIDDTYNSSPSSLIGALTLLGKSTNYKIAILGDMKELGKTTKRNHINVGKIANDRGLETFVGFFDIKYFDFFNLIMLETT